LPEIDAAQFFAVDIRVGTVLRCEPFRPDHPALPVIGLADMAIAAAA
jgi:hypothetical protein